MLMHEKPCLIPILKYQLYAVEPDGNRERILTPESHHVNSPCGEDSNQTHFCMETHYFFFIPALNRLWMNVRNKKNIATSNSFHFMTYYIILHRRINGMLFF